MRGIILAAGISSRLGLITKDKPKCLLKIGGITILEYQLTTLHNAGIRDVIVVTGYLEEKIRKIKWPGMTLIYNPRYKETNSLGSLWYAKEFLEDGAIVLNSDVIFDKKIVRALVDANDGYSLAVEFKRCDEEDMKVMSKNGLMLGISKDLDVEKANGEFIGLAKISAKGNGAFVQTMSDMVRGGEDNLFFDLVFQRLVERGYKVGVMDIGDTSWIEIDYPKDLRDAKRMFPRLT